jgi:hypothetical protein
MKQDVYFGICSMRSTKSPLSLSLPELDDSTHGEGKGLHIEKDNVRRRCKGGQADNTHQDEVGDTSASHKQSLWRIVRNRLCTLGSGFGWAAQGFRIRLFFLINNRL